MKELHTEIEIDASAERVWDILTDFASYPQWNPFIRPSVASSRWANASKFAWSLPIAGA
jgi:uncharacterized protein YndB with AHSA1/START domain